MLISPGLLIGTAEDIGGAFCVGALDYLSAAVSTAGTSSLCSLTFVVGRVSSIIWYLIVYIFLNLTHVIQYYNGEKLVILHMICLSICLKTAERPEI